MAIQISPNGRLMTIQTNDSSYQMLADKNGVLLHLYYGSSIGAEDLSDLIVRSDVGFLEIQRKQDLTAHIHLIHCRRRLLLVV